ncbi:hypothetical protein [Schlesneria sp. DSM 10557]|uniref:hypothetical protein n=1 Tax=Schlesneria sp. DSM 10557 TaxID=3044399 RepID=UPI00359F951E
MPERIKRTLLLVEDDTETQGSWSRDIDEFNTRQNTSVTFVPLIVGDQEHALEILRNTYIDCAIVDLRIPAAHASTPLDAKAESGNAVLGQILRSSGMPAVVYSGYEEEVSEIVSASHIKVVTKRGGAQVWILEYLLSHASLMEAMASTREKLSAEISTLFHQSIWPRWSKTWASLSGNWSPTEVITRQVVAHVAEKLGDTSQHHPDEFYFVPPLKADRLVTGDLVTYEGSVYVLLNPRCNMDRCEYPMELTLALCTPVGESWTKILKKAAGDANQRNKAIEAARRYASQDHSLSKHFIPVCDGQGPWLVEFDRITNVGRDLASQLVTGRIATISPQFLPNLIQRYSSYLGRIGQPDLNCEILVQLPMSAPDTTSSSSQS